MRILICSLSLMLLVPQCLHAQKQYWGTTSNTGQDPGSILPFGSIVRVDSTAMHPEIVLAFDTSFATSLGMPTIACGLMQASNGLIYYMTQENSLPYRSRIIALDPVMDSAWVAAELGTTAFPWRGQRWGSSLVEGEPGVLIDATADPFAASVAFRFNMTSGQLSTIATLPSGIDDAGYAVRPSFIGTLFNATDNKIYGGTSKGPLSGVGALSWLEPAVNSFSLGHVLDKPSGNPVNGVVQLGDKLYSTTGYGGAQWDNSPLNGGWGTIGSYDLATSTYQKVLDLPYSCRNPNRAMVKYGNDALFGEAVSDVVPGSPFNTVLFAYYPPTNTLEIKMNSVDLGVDIVGSSLQIGLLSASNGKIYGSFQNGIFEYDPVADTLRLRAPLQYLHGGVSYSYGLYSPLIEICRKPNYKPRATTNYNVCAGSYFAYDLQNVNATSVVWRRNGTVVPTQTNQQLEFATITVGDAGVWTCTMTNACGVTVPPSITITVNAGAFTPSTIGGDTLLCGQGDSALLSGNSGGTWNTGATTADLAVTQPGIYYVTNQNACGMSMSNLLHVAHSDSAAVPPSVHLDNWNAGNFGTKHICPGSVIPLTGNSAGPWGLYTPGTWSTGATGASILAQDTGAYYVSIANACNADTVFVTRLEYVPYPPPPAIAFTDANGFPADNLLCGTDSVWLQAAPLIPIPDPQPSYTWYSAVGYIAGQASGGAWVSEAGMYTVDGYWCSSILPMDTINIQWSGTPPPEPAVIQPDQAQLTGCELDTVALTSLFPNAYWTWLDGNGTAQRDTSQQITVDWNIGGNGFYALYNYNGCGESQPDYIQVMGTPVPAVQYSESNTMACMNHPAFPLTPGFPAGGTYSGAGVSGDSFDPALAGLGTHAITYSYGSGNCMGHATANITVDLCTGVEEAVSESGIRILPNPNSGRFTIQISKAFNHGEATLFDAKGTRMGAVHKLVVGSNVLEPAGLSPGVYQVRMEIDGQVEYRSIVIIQEQ